MGDQIRTLTLKCPSCGSGLEVSPDMERFSCGYCGTEQMVQRRGGTVSLKLITAAISKVQVGTDKTAAELALVRLQQELDDLEHKPFNPPLPKWNPPGEGSNAGLLISFGGISFYVAMVVLCHDSLSKSATQLVLVIAAAAVLIGYAMQQPSEEFKRLRAAWNVEAEKLRQQEKKRIQAERERILSQIALNKQIVGHNDIQK